MPVNDPRQPSSTRFVILGMDRVEAQRLLAESNEVEVCAALTVAGDMIELRLSAATGDDRRAAWQKVRSTLAPECQILPALEDNEGKVQFPTGTIVVRFAESPSDEALDAFAREHRLELLERNPYLPVQVTFAPQADEAEYLPDVVERLEGDWRTHRAWPEVLDRPMRNP